MVSRGVADVDRVLRRDAEASEAHREHVRGGLGALGVVDADDGIEEVREVEVSQHVGDGRAAIRHHRGQARASAARPACRGDLAPGA
jgi:hypothetical protein